MQFGFLCAIAPVEILVGPERRRALIDALERLFDIVQEEDVRGQKGAAALLLGGSLSALWFGRIP